ncbi:MalM family protein [Photobacterium damselae]|uniref:MalM family protein n=1 Tax=Photobacterium damselae TaxID=38293 RepID=UPI001EFDCB51|nr:MalM family protein [Photobacterium damselae]MCG9706347.1 MalM family protein [Photobacterium damselae]
MNKAVALAISAVLLSGCAQQTQSLDTSVAQAQIKQSSGIHWQPLNIPTKVTFTLDKNSQTSQQFNSTGAIAAFQIPANRGAITVDLQSIIDQGVYAPNIAFVDNKGEVLQTFSFADFNYKPAKFLDGDLLEGKFTFLPPITETTVNMVIYTTAKDLAQKTEVLHPAKAYAISHGNVPPEIPNPGVNHSPYGKLNLSISTPYLTHQPQAQASVVVADQAPTLDETKSYYLDGIKQAVKKNDIEKAMKLLDEAERLGIDKARSVFITSVKAQS